MQRNRRNADEQATFCHHNSLIATALVTPVFVLKGLQCGVQLDRHLPPAWRRLPPLERVALVDHLH